MSSLRPTSVCDTTPLQRLESQSSSGEPSSPTPTLNGNGLLSAGSLGTGTTTPTTTTTGTLSLPNYNNNNNHSKIEVHLNNFMSGGGTGGPSEKLKMDYRGARVILARILQDGALMACVGLPIIAFHYWGTPYKRGFFCDDESLKHPYRPSTVKNYMLYIAGFVIPVAVIITVEFFVSNYNRMHGLGNLSADRYYISNLAIPECIVECYKRIGLLMFGACVGQLSIDIAKYSVGRLRPHFFEVCQPLLEDGTTCDDPINVGRYIEDFTCRGIGITPRILKEVRLSFPSGHATFSFYAMLYIAIYLQQRMCWRRCKMFKHLLQFMFLMFAWYTSLTRVSDYKHHWTDVLAGSGIGVMCAIIMSSTTW